MHLMTLTLEVNFAATLRIGGPAGGDQRRITPVLGGSFTGEKLNGIVLPGGADWVLVHLDGSFDIDVRITLKTGDGALIYMPYTGSFTAPSDVMRRFYAGELLGRHEYRLETRPRFETGDERYLWLNDLSATGVGEQTRSGPVYVIETDA